MEWAFYRCDVVLLSIFESLKSFPSSLASGYASPHILSHASPEIVRVEAGRMASGIKIPWGAWLGFLLLSYVWLLQDC